MRLAIYPAVAAVSESAEQPRSAANTRGISLERSASRGETGTSERKCALRGPLYGKLVTPRRNCRSYQLVDGSPAERRLDSGLRSVRQVCRPREFGYRRDPRSV